MKIGIIGPNTQVRHLVELFKDNNIDYINFNETMGENFIKDIKKFIKLVKGVDIVYHVYGGSSFNTRLILSKLFGKKVINHWIGTDILVAQKNMKKVKIMQKFIDVNLACSKLIKSELKEMGIKSMEIAIIPSGLKCDYSNVPKEHAVLVYLPKGKEEFYGVEYIKVLAKKFNKIKFYIVANDDSNILPYDNVEFLGYLNLEQMQELYNKISILIRLPKHDGLSLMVLEALMKGKEVIYKYELPYTHYGNSIESVEEIFDKIINDNPKINKKGHDYVVNNYNNDIILNKIIKVFKEVR